MYSTCTGNTHLSAGIKDKDWEFGQFSFFFTTNNDSSAVEFHAGKPTIFSKVSNKPHPETSPIFKHVKMFYRKIKAWKKT